jgi:signal transduction histidine kinase
MPSPNAERKPASDVLAPLRKSVASSFQLRLTYAFVGVVALTLALVSPVVINRLDDYFRTQETENLRVRQVAAGVVVRQFIQSITIGQPVLVAHGTELNVNPIVRNFLAGSAQSIANFVAQADVRLSIGPTGSGIDGQPDVRVKPLPDGVYSATVTEPPGAGQARDPAVAVPPQDFVMEGGEFPDWGVRVEVISPYTSRASTITAVTGVLFVIAMIAFAIAVVVAAILSRRFTAPIRRLTEASRAIAEGDLESRVSPEAMGAGTLELVGLARQFNTMADRLQESVSIIRRDRDRSRDFLADVSHELRTPISALRTFNELLQGDAGNRPETRAEFLESSAVQLERLDWLAQNLLELSKLDSGLLLLELRPDDVRGAVESAVEQAGPAAAKRRIQLTLDTPDAPLRIRHDAPRVGQIVTNLVGNAIKFTGRGGRVRVRLSQEPDGGARIEVSDTGVGIDAVEMPRIFERFYRGSRANEARSTGSGLGLAIVKSIVDMHGGTVAVESRIGHGSTFVVTLPRDPRDALEAQRDAAEEPPSAATAPSRKVADSSSADLSSLNREGAR